MGLDWAAAVLAEAGALAAGALADEALAVAAALLGLDWAVAEAGALAVETAVAWVGLDLAVANKKTQAKAVMRLVKSPFSLSRVLEVTQTRQQ